MDGDGHGCSREGSARLEVIRFQDCRGSAHPIQLCQAAQGFGWTDTRASGGNWSDPKEQVDGTVHKCAGRDRVNQSFTTRISSVKTTFSMKWSVPIAALLIVGIGMFFFLVPVMTTTTQSTTTAVTGPVECSSGTCSTTSFLTITSTTACSESLGYHILGHGIGSCVYENSSS